MTHLSDVCRTIHRFSGITSQSSAVIKGNIYVAIAGTAHDGHAFIADARARGAQLIIGSQASDDADYVQVENPRAALAELAAAFYRYPADEMLIVGITGTSGKTTSAYLLESILTAAGHVPGLIGTVTFRSPKRAYPSTHTTPDPVQLQRLLREMRDDGCNAVVMEVSSHALDQSRVHGISFDGVLFTNLTPEHLDYHTSLDDYFAAKSRLFFEVPDYSRSRGKKTVGAVNCENPFGEKLFARAQREKSLSICRGFTARLSSARCDWNGIHGEENGVPISSPLIGNFNLSNILGALHLSLALGLSESAIARGINALHGVPGRMESCGNDALYAIVDYAHKPDALEKVLLTLRELRREGQKIITVFGCGGDRDKTKRPIMGEIATRLSDHVVVTSDNPRTEVPEQIIQEILVGTGSARHVSVEPDRRRAIRQAISIAGLRDLILIAGKGHEDYQILGKDKIHFDDREVLREELSKK